MILPALVIVTAAARTSANLVWEAMGRGPNNLSQKLTDQASPAWDATPTHYYMHDAGASDGDVAEWQAMADGDLPAISGTWGADGVISAADAQAAVSGSNLQVYSASGSVNAIEHRDGILAGRGLYVIPEQEV